MNAKIIIFGSSGCLAQHIGENLNKGGYNLKKISRKNFDYINNNNKLFNVVKKFKPRVIINCAAMSELDKCRADPKKAYEINTIFPYKLGILSKTINAVLIHFSTDAVFDGKKKTIYTINDKALPDTVYGQSKIAGEKLIDFYDKSVIIRLPLLYGKHHKKQIIGILLDKLKKGKKIFASKDVYSTPINSEDIAIFIRKNISKTKINKLLKKKIIHLSSNKRVSIYNFMKKISFIIGKPKNVVAVKDSFFNKKYNKPKNLGLRANVDSFKSSKLYKFVYDCK